MTAYGASAARPNFGNFHVGRSATPERPLELFEFELCPYCRLAREALSALSLDPLVYPCPKGGKRFREEVKGRGGRYQFPYLVDPNTGVAMYESADIVAYLFDRYGAGNPPWFLRRRAFAVTTSMLASAFRPARGRGAVPSRAPEAPLELFSYEGSPYCRLAREALCELELPYRLRNAPRRSPDRDEAISVMKKMQFPFLRDPNTGAAMHESSAIRDYLYDTYAL